MIPYGRQNITEEDIIAVTEVLNSDWLTQGPKVSEFENAVAKFYWRCLCRCDELGNIRTSCCLPCAGSWSRRLISGQYRIHLLLLLIVEFYVVPTWILLTLMPDSYCMDPISLAEKLEKAEISGQLPKVLIPVHFSGQSANMAAIKELAERYEIYVVEDAAHAIGGRYLDYPIGSCQFSDIAVFSFHPVKIITTAEGGMATTNDPKYCRTIKKNSNKWYY